MKRNTKITAATALAVAVGAMGVATAVGAGGGDSDETVSGPAAHRAQAAALEVTNGGRANSIERDSENGAVWEVEVTKPDGKTVDVRLDGDYKTVVVESDGEEAEGSGDNDSDSGDDRE